MLAAAGWPGGRWLGGYRTVAIIQTSNAKYQAGNIELPDASNYCSLSNSSYLLLPFPFRLSMCITNTGIARAPARTLP